MLATERFVKRLLAQPEIKDNQGAIIILNLFLAVGRDMSSLEKQMTKIQKEQAKIRRGLGIR